MTKSSLIVFMTFIAFIVCLPFVFADENQTVAVLYFQNNTGNQQLDWLSKGIADMLITDLAKPKKLKIVERVQVEKLAQEQAFAKGFGDEATAPQAGKFLGAGSVVIGSIYQAGGLLRIDARVVDTESGEVGETASAQGTPSEIFDMEKQIALEILKNLGVKLSDKEKEFLSKRSTTSYEAAAMNYTGLDLAYQGKLQESVPYFQKALQFDPSYTEAKQNLQTVSKYVDMPVFLEKVEQKKIQEEQTKANLQSAAQSELEIKLTNLQPVACDNTGIMFFFYGWVKFRDGVSRPSSDYRQVFLGLVLTNKFGKVIAHKVIEPTMDNPQYNFYGGETPQFCYLKDQANIYKSVCNYPSSVLYPDKNAKLTEIGEKTFCGMVVVDSARAKLITSGSVLLIYGGDDGNEARNAISKFKENISKMK